MACNVYAPRTYFSACVDAGYDIKESITDIPRDIQQTMQ